MVPLQRLQETVLSGQFEILMNIMLSVNALTVIISSIYDINDIDAPAIFDILEIFFTFIYVVEVFIKCAVLSWGEYWTSSASNKFDCVTSLLL